MPSREFLNARDHVFLRLNADSFGHAAKTHVGEVFDPLQCH